MIQPKTKYNECSVNNTTLAEKKKKTETKNFIIKNKIVTHQLVFHSKQKAHQMYCKSLTITIQSTTSRKIPLS